MWAARRPGWAPRTKTPLFASYVWLLPYKYVGLARAAGSPQGDVEHHSRNTSFVWSPPGCGARDIIGWAFPKIWAPRYSGEGGRRIPRVSKEKLLCANPRVVPDPCLHTLFSWVSRVSAP